MEFHNERSNCRSGSFHSREVWKTNDSSGTTTHAFLAQFFGGWQNGREFTKRITQGVWKH